MKRVTGIGGVFFKAKDPEKLREWYRTHLGIEAESWGAVFRWRDDPRADDASTAWSVFPEETKHFEPCQKPCRSISSDNCAVGRADRRTSRTKPISDGIRNGRKNRR